MFYAYYVPAIFVIIFWCSLWILHILAIIHAIRKLNKISEDMESLLLPGISIIKPIKGVDANLSRNVETFFNINYPKYELLFCIEHETDEAVNVICKLKEKYSSIDARIFLGGQRVGVNPKINNMQPAYVASKYECIMISDSSIRMKENSLRDVAYCMKHDVGIVHQMPFTSDQSGFPASVEKVYFGTSHARIYLVADYLQVNCHTGMSTLIKKSLLDDVGGLAAFGCYLAEDYFIAKSIMDRGHKITISNQPALQNSGCVTLESFRCRLQRWVKLRSAMVPHTTITEPLSECLVIGLLASISTNILFSVSYYIFIPCHVLAWFIFDWVLLRIIQGGPLPFGFCEFVCAWFYREVVGPYSFFHAVCRRRNVVKWRSRTYRLLSGGRAEEYSNHLLHL